jgi:hypothetical protein
LAQQKGPDEPGLCQIQAKRDQSAVALPSGAMLGLGIEERMPNAWVARWYQGSDFKLTDRFETVILRFLARSDGRRDF